MQTPIEPACELLRRSQVMRREIRLRRGSDFERVRANRRSWAHPLLVFTVRARDDDGTSRIGIVVGRRLGKAVERNLVKRRIREAVRATHPAMPPGHDIVLIARPAAASASTAELLAALQTLLGRARLRRILIPPAAVADSGGQAP